MINSVRAGIFYLALLAAAAAAAETRMQVSAGSTPVYTRPAGDAQQIGKVAAGEILFVARMDNEWAAIAPPDRIDLWLNKDFIEGNRVIANSIQIRSGPGIQYDIVGTLARGAPVLPRGDDGDWCRIAPPSSAILWVRKSDLSEVRSPAAPTREVATATAPASAEKPQPPPAAPAPPKAVESQTPPSVQPAKPAPPKAPAGPPPSPPTPPVTATPKVAPSVPQASIPQPAERPSPAAPSPPPPPPVATIAAPPKPVTEATGASIAPAARAPAVPPPQPRPAVAAEKPAPPPAATAIPAPPPAVPARRQPRPSAVARTVPAPASTVAAQKSQDLDIQVDPQLVEDLDLAEGMPDQGKPVQVEGELRSAPFLAASPSRYRLLDEDEDGLLEMVCHVHGDSEVLRQYIGKGVSIRGREYWVDSSDMPVVVVGQIVPLSPAYEPVMY